MKTIKIIAEATDISILYNVFAGVTLYYLVLTFLTYLFRNKIQRSKENG